MPACLSNQKQTYLQTSPVERWISVVDAARLTGQSQRHWRRIAVREAATTARAIQRPPASGVGRPIWYVDRTLDSRLARVVDTEIRDQRDRESLIHRFPADRVDRAMRKSYWLTCWRSLCATNPRRTAKSLARRIVDQARQVEGDGFRISVRSLQIWHRQYQQTTQDGSIAGVAGLIDRYGGVTSSDSARSSEAIDYFYSLYHTQNRLSASKCHEITCQSAKTNGWSWSSSASATNKWLMQTDDRALTCLLRDGSSAYSRKYLPHLEMDYSLIQPGRLYVCDHTQCDFWVQYRKSQIRPWLTAIQDCRSRVIVGWHLGSAPHQDAILSAMYRGFKDFAIPQTMRIDNGKDFTSKLITGLTKHERISLRRELGRDYYALMRRDENLQGCDDTRWLGIAGELGIELIYAIAYSPWSKGTIERWFRTFHGYCKGLFATYCGNAVLTRPECLDEIRRGYTRQQKKTLRAKYGRDWKKAAALKFVDQSDVPTMEQARIAVANILQLYHHRVHSADDMRGLSPLATWDKATSLRRAVDDQLSFLLQIRGKYRVGGNGVHLVVGAARLGYGVNCPQLSHLKGRDVLIALDQQDISHCFALDVKTRQVIARLSSNDRIDPLSTADDAREAIAEDKRAQSIMQKAARQAATRTRNQTQRVNAYVRKQVASLRKTGTDDVKVLPAIQPVSTGFDAVSKPVQPTIANDRTNWLDDIEDIFDDSPPKPQEPDFLDDIEDIFIPDVQKDQPLDDDWTDWI